MTIFYRQFLVFTTFFIGYGAAGAGFYDINELRSLSYETNITDDFLWFTDDIDVDKVTAQNIDEYEERIVGKIPDEHDEAYIFPTSNSGQKFICVMPNIQASKVKQETGSKNPKYYSDAIAASFYVNKCTTMKNGGWWRYELCRGQMIYQIHGEPKSEKYVRNILGIFDGNFTMPTFQVSTPDRLLYVAESYSSGTFCDLKENKNPRRTTVKYVCDAILGTHEAYIYSVEEIKPCEYEMLVKVGSLCKFDEFLAPNKVNAHEIKCHPYLAKSQVRNLLQSRVSVKEKAISEKDNRDKALIELEKIHKTTHRRYMAALKTSLTYSPKDQDNIENARMAFVANYFHYMSAMLTVKEGIPLSAARNNSFFAVINLSNKDSYLVHADYDTLKDDDKGNLWYFLHDKTWPRDQFPKSIEYVTAANSQYQRIVEWFTTDELLIHRRYNFRKSVNNLLRDGIYNASKALVPMDDEFLEEYWRILTTERTYWFETALNDEYSTLESAHDTFSGTFSELALDATFDQVAFNVRSPEKIKDPSQKKNIKKLTDSLKNSDGSVKKDFQLFGDDSARESMEKLFRHLLAPYYFVLSANYIRRTYIIFEPQLLLYIHDDPDDMYHTFHKNLLMDFIDFSKMLSAGYLWKLQKDFIYQHNPKKDPDAPNLRRFWHFEEEWPSIKKRYYDPKKAPHVKMMKEAIRDVFEGGPVELYNVVKYNVYHDRKDMDLNVEETLYELKSSESRKMEDLIEKLAQEVNPKEATAEDVDSIFNVLKDRLNENEKTFEPLNTKTKKTVDDDGIEILDALFGGDEELESKMDSILKSIKNSDLKSDSLKLKIVKVDGSELIEEELDIASKNFVNDIFDRFDAKKKFAAIEDAYSKKYDLGESEEDKKSNN